MCISYSCCMSSKPNTVVQHRNLLIILWVRYLGLVQLRVSGGLTGAAWSMMASFTWLGIGCWLLAGL